jgi:hypothetical protein
VAVAVGIDPDDGVNLALEQGMAVAPFETATLAGTGLGWRHRVRQDCEGSRHQADRL